MKSGEMNPCLVRGTDYPDLGEMVMQDWRHPQQTKRIRSSSLNREIKGAIPTLGDGAYL
jgi:hypothetical protein